jgi:predicted GIY-YIG superfamily endonuclease
MVFIYILQLEQEKYYVGKTTNPSFRIDKHFTSNGSAWTKKYKPISILEIIQNCDDYDEDKYTIKYMEKYGINNVRGGSFCEIKLRNDNIITLNQMIKSITDKCYICGKDDHFANDCKKVSIKKEKIPIININEKCDCPTSYFSSHRRGKCILNNIMSYFDDEDDDIDKLFIQDVKEEDNNDCCFRCGRKGHYVSSCYASKHINGYYIKK